MFETLEQIKAANEAAGFYWFSEDTMRGFDTRLVAGVHYGHLFVYSDRNYDDSGRDFKIAYAFNSGDVRRLDVEVFPTLAAAQAFVTEHGAQVGGFAVRRRDDPSIIFGLYVGTLEQVRKDLTFFKFEDGVWELVHDDNGVVIEDIGREIVHA